MPVECDNAGRIAVPDMIESINANEERSLENRAVMLVNSQNIDKNTSDILDHEFRITNIEGIIDTGEQSILDLQSDVTKLKSDVGDTSTLTTTASNLSAAVNELDSEVEANTAEISTNASNISINTSDISSNTQSISDLTNPLSPYLYQADTQSVFDATTNKLATMADIPSPYVPPTSMTLIERSSAAGGGAGTAGSFKTRLVNIEQSNNILDASLNPTTGEITLPAGSYRVTFSAVGNTVAHQTRLFNSTTVAEAVLGVAVGSGGSSTGIGSFDITAQNVFLLQTAIDASIDGNDLGKLPSWGVGVYSTIEIIKVG